MVVFASDYIIKYKKPEESYFSKEERKKNDFSNLVSNKKVDFLPRSYVGDGVLGYTFLGADYMVIRDDLYGEKKKKLKSMRRYIHQMSMRQES